MADTALPPTSPVLDMLKEDNAADIDQTPSADTATSLAPTASSGVLISSAAPPSHAASAYKSSSLSLLSHSDHLKPLPPLDSGSATTYSKTDYAVIAPTAAAKDLTAAHLSEPSSAAIHPAAAATAAYPSSALTAVDAASPSSDVAGLVAGLSRPGAADGWVDVQEKTFSRWCNYYLSQRDLRLDSLHDGFRDGNLLCHLVEILSGRKLAQRWKPSAKTQVQRLDNLSVGFEALKRDGVKLVNVRVQEIEAGNDKITMALVWAMIGHYQIDKIAKLAKNKRARQAAEAEKERAAAALLAEEEGGKKADEYGVQRTEAAAVVEEPVVKEAPMLGAKADLLAWVNSKVAGYDVPAVRDFTTTFSDGNILAALVDALLIEQKNLISLLTKAAIEHEPEDLTADGKKRVPLTGDRLADTQTAILRAENELRIPPLVDAADLVSHPNEQAVMTYIACFRDREHTLTDIGEQQGLELQTETTETVDAPPAVADMPSQDDIAATMAGISSAETVVVAPSAGETVTVAADNTTMPVVEEVTQPSVLYVASVPAGSDQSSVVVSEETTVAQPAHTLHINPSAAVSEPVARPGTPVHASEHEEETAMPTEASSGTTAHTGSAASPVVMDSFAGPTLSRSDEIKEVDVCMTNVELQYVQARPDGTLHVSAANTSWSVWTVVDSQATDIVYFRDHKGRYITSDDTGRVFMAPKSEQAKWTVLRGKVQHFRNQSGRYLTAADGRVVTETTAGMHAALTLNFPVIEGILRKKGRRGLKRWQARYFAFNGAVMSYWEKKEDAGVTTAPKGLWYINNLSHVNIDTKDDTKFYIYFKDGQAVALDAIQSAECLRWVHSLEMTGIRVRA